MTLAESFGPDIHTELIWAEQNIEHGQLEHVLKDMETNYEYSKKYTYGLDMRREKLIHIYEASTLSGKERPHLTPGTEVFKWRGMLLDFLIKSANLSEVPESEREEFMDRKQEHLTNAVHNALHEIPVSEEQMQTYEEFIDSYKILVQEHWYDPRDFS